MSNAGGNSIFSAGLSEVVTRILIASMFFGSLITTGLGLQLFGALSIFVTIIVLTITFTVQLSAFREKGEAPATSSSGRFGLLLDWLAEAPILGRLARNLGTRLIGGFGLALVIAVVENTLARLVFGWLGADAGSLISFWLVMTLVNAWFGLATWRGGYKGAGRQSKLLAGVARLINREIMTPTGSRGVVIGALARSTATVLFRGVGLLAIPYVFSNVFFVIGFGLAGVVALCTFDSVPGYAARFKGA